MGSAQHFFSVLEIFSKGPLPDVDPKLFQSGRTKEDILAWLQKHVPLSGFRFEGISAITVTDITEHRTREGKLYCAVVLDTYSRRVVGWSIDSTQTTSLVLNALGMATPSAARIESGWSCTATVESRPGSTGPRNIALNG